MRRFAGAPIALVASLLFGSVVVRSASHHPPKRVLLLYSYDREEGIFAEFDRVFRSELTSRAHDRVEFFTEYLDTVRFNSPEHSRDLARLLQTKYSSLKPDLVVPVSLAALRIAIGEGKNRGPFFDVPVVTLFNGRSAKAIQLAADNRNRNAGVTWVATTDEPDRTLDLALTLQPDTKRVVIITGSSAREHMWLQELQGDFVAYENRVEFLYYNEMSMDTLLQKVRALPPQTIILYTYFFEDADGQFFLPEEALDLISRVSPVPVYGIEDTYIGHGVVGGYMTNSAGLGVLAAQSAARVLNGEKPPSVPVVADNSARVTVDWRELERWNINENHVPARTVVLFREPTAWERYRIIILVAAGFAFIETLLIMALVFNLRRLKRTERALHREKTLADAVIESLPGVLIMQDESGRNIRWNKNAQESVRYPLAGVGRLGNVAEYDRGTASRAVDQVFSEGQAEVEADLLTREGRTTPYYFSGVRVELEGTPYMIATGVDLSARKQAETALRRSEAQLRSFVDNAPYGIARASTKQDRFLSANPALVRILGYSSEQEVLKLNLSRDLYLEGDSGGFRAQPTRADFFTGVEFTWKRRDGKPVTVRASGRRFSQKEGEDFLEIIVEDVTTHRTLEDQLRQAQKMEALGQLAGSTAHDFNNLLAVIIGHCELLAATLKDEGPSINRVEIIKKAGERAASLTAQLLAFSRRQTMQVRTLNINTLVAETNKMLEHLMGEDIEHRLNLNPNIGMVRLDSGQVVQVIMNLAVNARDAMPNGGTFSVTTDALSVSENTAIGDVVVPSGSYVTLTVSDTGSGIDPDTLAHIFEPFFTTKPIGRGTGLGLATVFGIVKQSGGFISVESEPGKGTTFKIYFPQVESSPERVSTQTFTGPTRSSGTVLVVEDEPAFRDLLVENLQSAGYRVLVGENGVDALNVAESYSERIDLLLTDVIMPQMSGSDLARYLKKARPEAKVLYMSGYTDDRLHAFASDDEVPLLQKPFHLTDLLRKIDELLKHGAKGSSQPEKPANMGTK